MAQRHVFSREIGHGRARRRNDSSSSRESSPSSGRSPRSFSPVGSDDDTIMPPIQNDDALPQQPKPLIRQPVAFSANVKATSISTYEAAPAVKAIPGAFLPGQEVVVPVPKKPKPPKPKKASGPKAAPVKRPRRPEVFAQQTTRFRLSTYDPTPPEQPPINQGNGPYASLYRGVVPNASGKPTTDTNDTPRQVSPAVHPSPSHSPDPTGNQSQPASTPPSSQGLSALARPQSLEPSIGPDPHLPIGSASRPPSNLPNSAHPSGRSNDDTHHRSDYTNNFVERASPLSRSPQQLSQDYVNDHRSTDSHQRRCDSTGVDRASYPTVTLLIQDLRSGEVDHQLAEVNVPIKETSEGLWADGRDIAEELQSSQSRIDGPARAFIRRGKYRQFVFRVSAENRDEIGAVRVALKPDRSLELFVETLQPPGVPPSKPRVPIYDDAEQDSDVSMRDNGMSVRKRRPDTSDPYDYGDSRGSVPPSFSSKVARRDYLERSPRGAAVRHAFSPAPSRPSHDQRQRQRSYSPFDPNHANTNNPLASERRRTHRSMGGYDSVSDDDGDSQHRGQYLSSLKSFLESRQGGPIRLAKVGNQVLDLVDLFQKAQTLLLRFEGQHVPGFDKPIEKDDICELLKVDEDHHFWAKCNETLKLWDLYGQAGPREDKQVMGLLVEHNNVATGSCLHVAGRLLRLLREADANWKHNSPESQLPSLSLPPGPSPIAPPMTSPSIPPNQAGGGLGSPREDSMSMVQGMAQASSSMTNSNITHAMPRSASTVMTGLPYPPPVVAVAESRASKAMFVQ